MTGVLLCTVGVVPLFAAVLGDSDDMELGTGCKCCLPLMVLNAPLLVIVPGSLFTKGSVLQAVGGATVLLPWAGEAIAVLPKLLRALRRFGE